jgi:hypothetical protein
MLVRHDGGAGMHAHNVLVVGTLAVDAGVSEVVE